MGHVLRLTAVAALLALLPVSAYAQVTDTPFAGSFQFTDRNGTGTLTITPLAGDSSANGVQRVQVALSQNGQTGNGVGAYYTPEGGTAPALLSFGLIDSGGRSLYFQARLTRGDSGLAGEGTYFFLDEPETEYSWSIEAPVVGSVPDDSTPGVAPIVSSLPARAGEWSEIALADAIGGVYYAVENQAAAPVKTATWTGGLPTAGQYRVEAFIPAPSDGATPRTESATYRISSPILTDPVIVKVSQNVTSSQWVTLGTFALGSEYQVLLTDQTGEPAFTRSVVANAVRFTPLTDAS